MSVERQTCEVPVHDPLVTYVCIMGRGCADQSNQIWPRETFRWIPDATEADSLAAKVRELAGVSADEALLNFAPILDAGSFDLASAELGAHRGGHEAMMIPSSSGGFVIRVDPRPPGDWTMPEASLRAEVSEQRMRFRAAHEMAHSFFYARTPAGRRRQRTSTPAEEAFCDRFAASLLLPPAAVRDHQPDARSVVALHERYRVSVELAARAVAAQHEQARIAIGYWPVGGADDRGALELQWTNLDDALALSLLRDGSHPIPCSAASPQPPRRQLVLARSG